MSVNVSIPDGEQKVLVELTVKEAMALSGFRFNQNSKPLTVARRKVKNALDKELLQSRDTVRYEELAH